MATKELVHVPRAEVNDVLVIIWRVSKVRGERFLWPDIKYFVDLLSALKRVQLELAVGKTVEVNGVAYGPEVPRAMDS